MIAGKTALVTGSTSGIGRAIACQLAQEGAHIILNGLAAHDEIETFRAGLERDHGVQVQFSDADLTDPDAIGAMMQEAAGLTGGVDILVNNAGTQFVAPLDSFPVDKWNLIIALNLSAAFHTTRLAVPYMKARGWGRIINIGSAHSRVASPFKSAYVAAKHGLSGLTRVTALEGATDGIRCNIICPGYVFTPLVEGQIADTAKARGLTPEQVKRDVLLAAQPTRDFISPEQIAGLASFLCSPAADQINGAEIPVDGGWTAQ